VKQGFRLKCFLVLLLFFPVLLLKQVIELSIVEELLTGYVATNIVCCASTELSTG